MNTFFRPQRMLAAIFVASLLMGQLSPIAAADSDKSQTAKTKKANKKAKKASGGKLTLLPHSGENSAQRSSRLKRECKGRVNAGACEGYTS